MLAGGTITGKNMTSNLNFKIVEINYSFDLLNTRTETVLMNCKPGNMLGMFATQEYRPPWEVVSQGNVRLLVSVLPLVLEMPEMVYAVPEVMVLLLGSTHVSSMGADGRE